MSDVVIKVENVGKLYRLGEIGTGTISHDLNRWWARVRGKEDPFNKIGETNDRTTKGKSDYVWSLKDISFEVKQGEALGIIGRNGAGKSTLLKILSKVTTPTKGRIKVKGRIASLLEVGTGFHPELTGRENIFLNGAILGMTKAEIKKKFDEIVDFSGVERYIDTPVKRYSSGMYVRLAFAVAAHLESEVLIVDEVLAVGDAEFQKKCLGKMGEVSKGEGRTVLFVSHNMSAMRELCSRGLLLNKGQLEFTGDIQETINNYTLKREGNLGFWKRVNQLNEIASFLEVNLINKEGNVVLNFDNAIETYLSIKLEVKKPEQIKTIAFEVRSATDISMFCSHDYDISSPGFTKGINEFTIKMPAFLRPGNYYLNIGSNGVAFSSIEYFDSVIDFEVIGSQENGKPLQDLRPGILYIPLQWVKKTHNVVTNN